MVFLFGNSFLSKNDQYAYLLLTANVSRPMYLFSKIISLMLIVLLFIWFVFFCFVIVGFLSSNQYIFSWEFALSYIFLFLYYIYYSLFGLIAVQLTQNIYTIMVPIVIVNLGTILNENPKSAVYYNFFFPSFNSNNLELQFGIIHSLIAIVILCFINLFLYWQKDL
ncbi:MAG: hypothetical protein PHP65_00280 [Bacilli bacterium]|nr:hypothetical protein [Bacilli bacterium]